MKKHENNFNEKNKFARCEKAKEEEKRKQEIRTMRK